MQPTEIQQPLNPWPLCTANTSLNLQLNAQLFTRAEDLFFAPFNELSFNLQFSQNEAKQLVVTGSFEGEVNLECQRCLKPVAVNLFNEFSWGLVTSDQAAANLARYLEPVSLENNRLNLFAALEDELLLSLPLVAYHEQGACQAKSYQSATEATNPVEEKPNKPFLVLHQLKKGTSK